MLTGEGAVAPSHLQPVLQQKLQPVPSQGPGVFLGPLSKKGFRDTAGVTHKGTRGHPQAVIV